MSLLHHVLFAWKCKNSHHKLALEALNHLQNDNAQMWSNLFIKNIETYLAGSKAPDTEFKDFRNHVLHVRDNYWGGAIVSTQKWYERTVAAMAQKDWKEAIYSAGVMSHYYTDPIQPFHTAQSEEEGKIHRAAEWSMNKAFEEMQQLLVNELGGYPDVVVPSGNEWLGTMVRQGAELSNRHYETVIDHYDLAKGVKNPPAGLDHEIKICIAQMIGHAAVGYARILDRAILEAKVKPPRTSVSLHGMLATMTIPLFWVTKKMADGKERAAVKAMYNEVRKTGRVDKTLPEDDREIRKLHAKEVLKVSLEELDKQEMRETGTKHVDQSPRSKPKVKKVKPAKLPPENAKVEPNAPVVNKPIVKNKVTIGKRNAAASGATTERSMAPVASPAPPTETKPVANASQDRGQRRFYLELHEPVEEAPSIGPKTARRLAKIGIKTVEEFLSTPAKEIADKLNIRHFPKETIEEWQVQAELAVRIPGVRGHDVQILAGIGVTSPDEIAVLQPNDLLTLVHPFAESTEGKRILRSGKVPDKVEIAQWIDWAGKARTLRAA